MKSVQSTPGCNSSVGTRNSTASGVVRAGNVDARASWSAAVLCRLPIVQRACESARGLAQSRTWQRFGAALCLLAALFVHPSTLHAQPAAPANRVLQLDGQGSYVQLPSNIFNDLTEATVEGWVKWDRLGNWMRFFDFGKKDQSMVIGNSGTSGSLSFEFFDSNNQRAGDASVPDALIAGRWVHIAVVTGKGGVRIYVNGALRAANSYTGSFVQVGNGSRNFLGRNNWKEPDGNVEELQGQMDEVRVWNHARTPEQIQANLFTTLTGKESGLVGYWNFDDGKATDLAPGQHHGELVGDVQFTTVTREYQLASGKVVGTDQKPVADVEVRVLSGGQKVATGKTDAEGNYYCLITAPVAVPCDIQATKDESCGWRFAVNLQQNGRVEAGLQLSDALNIKGKVRTMDDRDPREGVEVQLSRVAQSAGTNATPSTTRTDAFGEFKFLHLRPGEYRLQCISQAGVFAPVNNAVVNVRTEAVVTPVLFKIPPRLDITGTVQTLDDRGPIEAVAVQAIPVVPGAVTNSAPVSALTDKSGTFRMVDVKPGEYRLQCASDSGLVAPDPDTTLKVGIEGSPAPVRFRIAPPQPGAWRQFTRFDGVPPGNLFEMCFDRQGSLWITSNDGLARFDGQSWRTFTTRDGLTNNYVKTILLTRDGDLLTGTETGAISRFNGTRWEAWPQAEDLRNRSPVVCFFQDRDGVIWLGTYGGGIWYYKDGVWAHQHLPRVKENEVWQIAQDRSGTIWFGTSLGITRYEDGEWKFCEDEDGIGHPNKIAPGYAPDMFTAEVWALIIDRHDHLWAGTFRGVSRFDGKSWKQFTTADGLGEGGVGKLYEDRDGTIWASGPVWTGTAVGGFCRFDGNRWINVRPGETGPMIEDAAGNLWMAKGGGVSRFDRRHWQVLDTKRGLPTSNVQMLARDHQGRMLISLEADRPESYATAKAGLTGLAKNQIVRYDGRSFEPIELPKGSSQISLVFEDSKTNLWIAGSFGSGSFVGHLADGQWRGYGKKDGLNDWGAGAFAEDAAGRVWIGGSLNVCVFDGNKFEKQGGFVTKDWAKGVAGMARDRKGKMWITTHAHGVWRFDGEGDDGFMKWTTFNQTNGLPQDRSDCIFIDRKDQVWIGTQSSGVARYDGSSWKTWDRFNGLPRNYVVDIKEDRDGLIWVAQGNAVSVFDGTAWSSLDERDGLSIDCKTLLPESDGSMWLGGGGGLQRYTRQRTELGAPTLRLTGEDLEQSGSALQPPAVKQGTRLTFDVGARDFLTESAKLQFRYLISEGALTADALTNSATWSAPTLQRRLEWSTNRAGVYSLAVQFIDRDLNYSKPAVATLTVVPFWYRDARIMAPAGGGLMALLGWSGFLTLRYGHKRRETERLREQMIEQERQAREVLEAKNTQLESAKVAVETKAAQLEVAKEAAESAKDAAESANRAKSLFLANMSHEIRTPMNAILGYSQILRRDGELPPKYRRPIETIEKSGDHLLAMINDILDLSKIEAGRMELEETDFDLTSLIMGLKAMFKVRCEEQDLKLEVEGLGDSPCPVHADEGKLRQVLINLLGNAVKFTERGSVTLRVLKDDGRRKDVKNKSWRRRCFSLAPRRGEGRGEGCDRDGGYGLLGGAPSHSKDPPHPNPLPPSDGRRGRSSDRLGFSLTH